MPEFTKEVYEIARQIADAVDVLGPLLEDLTDASPPSDRSTGYCRGYSAGIRFARICVLDEIALNSSSFVSAARVRAALGRIAARLSKEVTLGDGDYAAGRRDAIAGALDRISRRQQVMSQGTKRPTDAGRRGGRAAGASVRC